VKRAAFCVVFVGLVASATSVPAQKAVKQNVTFEGKLRTYRVWRPDEPSGPKPAIVLLHGSGRDGTSLLDPWQPVAKKEGIVLIAPDSLDRVSWNTAEDGPDFLKLVVDAAAAAGGIDQRRVYVFGHSAGGHHAIDMALLESEYFAAAAVHAGALTFQEPDLLIQLADRKIPILIWSGTDDRVVPIDVVKRTEALLSKSGFPVTLTQMPKHTHDYYGVAGPVNEQVWKALKPHALTSDPKFKKHTFVR